MTVQRGKTSEDVEEVTKVEDDEVEPCALVVLSEAGKDVAAVICPFVDADGITGVEEKAETADQLGYLHDSNRGKERIDYPL